MKKLLLKALLLTAVAVGSAQAAKLDSLELIQGPLEDTSNSFVLGNVLGGERDMSLTVQEDIFGLGAKAFAGNGNLFLVNGFGTKSVLTMQWDGIDNSMDINPYGLGGVYLDATMFTIASDLSAWFTMNIWSGGDKITESYYVNQSGTLTFGSYSNVGAVELLISGIESYDMRMQPEITKVPEPGSYILLIVVIITSIFVGRFLARKPE